MHQQKKSAKFESYRDLEEKKGTEMKKGKKKRTQKHASIENTLKKEKQFCVCGCGGNITGSGGGAEGNLTKKTPIFFSKYKPRLLLTFFSRSPRKGQ